jgi:hypothetical protein
VATTGTPVFNYALKSDNTCITPAHVRLYMERKKNPNSEYSRWWANPTSYELAAGSITMTVPLTPDQWSDVNGRFGNADSTATANFRQAIQSLGSVGMTFGGGCFFGHGVNVSGGTARFTVTDFSVR